MIESYSYSRDLLIKHYAVKEYWEFYLYNHIFLTSIVVGGEWSASRRGHFVHVERALRYDIMGGLVNPQRRFEWRK
jgi:hypothetical protein